MPDWTPERRAAQSARLQNLLAVLTPEQGKHRRQAIRSAWTPERRAQQGERIRALWATRPTWQLRKLQGHRGGKSGWTPERRAAQRERLAAVRLAGEDLRRMALHREAVKRNRKAISAGVRARWTPERRRKQSARAAAQHADPLLGMRAGESLRLWHAQNLQPELEANRHA